ncbi:MAG: hypothetical protein KC656_15075, partial [Myxococcales bacterium]|nr:hypothetical protein [Myxococcales bacterium]
MFLVHLALAADPCAGIDPCTVLERTPVGKDREVVHVAYMKKADVPTNVGEPLYGEPGACNRHAWWMVDGAKTRPILEVCNDGYGASGVGEDDVSVKDGVFTHSQYGGSAWRWTNSRSIALFPPAWVASSGYNHYMGLIGMGSEWDYKAGRGRFTET